LQREQRSTCSRRHLFLASNSLDTFRLGAAEACCGHSSPALLKARLNVNEILTTLLLNYVAIIFMEHLFYGPWRDPAGFGFPGTAQIPEAAQLMRFAGTRISLGFPLALLGAVLLYVLLMIKSAWGYQIRVIGSGAAGGARYAGFNVTAKF
jgi:ABC-type uncharacterized transport system permease subunit